MTLALQIPLTDRTFDNSDSKLSPPLLTALRPSSWVKQHSLSDDGFCDSIASIPLSNDFVATLQLDGVNLSHRALDTLGLSTKLAWDLAAHNLIDSSLDSLYTRNSSWVVPHPEAEGIQVCSPAAPISHWLAHPYSASLLYQLIAKAVGCEQPFLLVPANGVVLGFPSDSAHCARELARLAAAQFRAGYPIVSTKPLVLVNGFIKLRKTVDS